MGSSASTTATEATRRPQPMQHAPKPPLKTENLTSKSLASKGRDVMISYSHADVKAMRKLEAALKSNGISVWVDESALTAGAQYLRAIGEAIVASKLFIILLSATSVQSKYCQDEVFLAYISNKTIFAASVLPYDEISKVIDVGMKLTLACVQWTFLDQLEKGNKEELNKFVVSVQAALERIDQEGTTNDEADAEYQPMDASKNEDTFDDDLVPSSMGVINKQALTYRSRGKSEFSLFSVPANPDESNQPDKFWKENFGNTNTVDWLKFTEVINKNLANSWSQLTLTDDMSKHVLSLMAKEMNVMGDKLQYEDYMMFCTKGRKVVDVDEAISLFAAATVAVREVFEIDSSVRLTAIEQLGDRKSKAVINVLLALLYDESQDVRVVAAISLAHAASEIKSIKTRSKVVNGLLSCLSNDDRLVRESGCLALGRMKSKAAIQKLVYLWRNDYISTVREAARIAIEQIGGEEAEQALHVTKVLGIEVEKLRKA